MKILEFKTEKEAQIALAVINEIAAAWWAAQGYVVEDVNGQKQLIGKNAKTGEDMPDKARTTTWAEIEKSPDGTFYFASPSSDERFAAWRNHIPNGINMPDDKGFPNSWVSVE